MFGLGTGLTNIFGGAIGTRRIITKMFKLLIEEYPNTSTNILEDLGFIKKPKKSKSEPLEKCHTCYYKLTNSSSLPCNACEDFDEWEECPTE